MILPSLSMMRSACETLGGRTVSNRLSAIMLCLAWRVVGLSRLTAHETLARLSLGRDLIARANLARATVAESVIILQTLLYNDLLLSVFSFGVAVLVVIAGCRLLPWAVALSMAAANGVTGIKAGPSSAMLCFKESALSLLVGMPNGFNGGINDNLPKRFISNSPNAASVTWPAPLHTHSVASQASGLGY